MRSGGKGTIQIDEHQYIQLYNIKHHIQQMVKVDRCRAFVHMQEIVKFTA